MAPPSWTISQRCMAMVNSSASSFPSLSMSLKSHIALRLLVGTPVAIRAFLAFPASSFESTLSAPLSRKSESHLKSFSSCSSQGTASSSVSRPKGLLSSSSSSSSAKGLFSCCSPPGGLGGVRDSSSVWVFGVGTEGISVVRAFIFPLSTAKPSSLILSSVGRLSIKWGMSLLSISSIFAIILSLSLGNLEKFSSPSFSLNFSSSGKSPAARLYFFITALKTLGRSLISCSCFFCLPVMLGICDLK
mmetsp:Transcript_24748/g.46515  ORF Transcript_24748/g.46515 Transcript_24748/m.46515 type:complete len:246 (+) Transcript_24748:125-862(+)